MSVTVLSSITLLYQTNYKGSFAETREVVKDFFFGENGGR